MCEECWKERGSPSHLSERIVLASMAIRNVYRLHICGGHLHIVLDDWNLEDDSLDFCDRWMDKDPGDDPALLAACRLCSSILRGMSEYDRASALRWAEDKTHYLSWAPGEEPESP